MPARLALLVPAAFAAVALAVPAAASAEVFVVNDRGDHVPGNCTNGDCTLREAAIAADGNLEEDTIRLPSRKPYRLKQELGSGATESSDGDIDILAGNGVTITHPGSGRAIVQGAGNEDRAFDFQGPGILRKLVVRRGIGQSASEAGGGVLVEDVVEIIDSRIKDNDAADVGGGIIVRDGFLYLRRSKVTGNHSSGEGGGMFVNADGGFEIDRSTIAGNDADDGGGIYTQSETPLNLIGASTIAGNDVSGQGGGVFSGSNGEVGLGITNSTITKNTSGGSGGGIYAAPDTDTTLFHATIARNRADADDVGPDGGGGVFVDGGDDFVQSINTLFARNKTTGGAFQDCDAPAPVGIFSSGGNLVTTEQDCPFFVHPEDIVDDQPKIEALEDNGGPTETIKLKPVSPAINQADAMAMAETDQRGVERQNPDIGAYERR